MSKRYPDPEKVEQKRREVIRYARSIQIAQQEADRQKTGEPIGD